MSLAAIKRRIKVGTKLQITRHDWPFLRLHNEIPEAYAAKQAAFFAVREVIAVKAGEIGLKTGEGDNWRTSWLEWPKANSIRETATGFEIDLNRRGDFAQLMQYEWR